ncbi:uncharacterized protein Z519_01768 [Cladophialophora bantiana CBS 173.52]|uniref:RRM domain-containing protein n=1 Tax=Cladophialophora bantiana (strain ATCC 10958 / CBS 173.52 / CDC B-1940 / NIH 8579) TaxID=1442370 RepID=A0A0D2IN19_CLAB1|nr:uncharacterized protein Z519_01768 [Cladophialophora bantiana CBS 173.52]KIW98184.1 hypothetical protein Z519_01768 [Cladophialophora bantiana CBS 173.52]
MSSHAKSRAAGGVLPVNAAARKNAAVQSASKSSPRTPAPRLRLIIRRLPPGLTEAEFWTILGDDWKVGNGKIEWAAYKDGKVSKDAAKPSRPARAYLKVKEQSLLDLLSKAVRESSFQDAKNTSKDPCLLGPPSLEFAPYNKMPVPRIRHDGRQGTIDQDQEFIDFLQSLTEPINKPASNGAEATDVKADTVTITPLVQYIKEKKANKAKEAAQAKAAKRESKEAKPTKSERTPTVIIKGKNTSNLTEKEKERVVKATQDAVKAANKAAAALQGKQTTSAKPETKQTSAKEAQPQPSASAASTPATTPSKRERNRERDSGRAAARMLQRDLGLLARENTSQRTPKTPSSSTATTNDTVASSSTVKPSTPTTAAKSSEPPGEQSKPTTPATTTTPAAPPTGPRAARTPNTTSTKPEPPSAPSASSARPSSIQRQSKTSSLPQPTSGAKSAFLKHANPSQGITEDLLQQVFKEFGAITRCEIDKKKGLGYVDFQEPEALKKAMAASPVKVAQGQVVVLENKSHHGKRGGGGGGSSQNQTASGQGKAGAASSSPVGVSPAANSPNPAAAAAQATAASQTPTAAESLAAASTTAMSSATPTVATPPTAPRGTARGGASGGRPGGRGSSGGKREGPRGASGAGQGQGGGKQGYRGGGGRGNFGGGRRSGGGQGNANANATAGTGASTATTTTGSTGSRGTEGTHSATPTPAGKEDGKKD